MHTCTCTFCVYRYHLCAHMFTNPSHCCGSEFDLICAKKLTISIYFSISLLPICQCQFYLQFQFAPRDKDSPNALIAKVCPMPLVLLSKRRHESYRAFLSWYFALRFSSLSNRRSSDTSLREPAFAAARDKTVD